MILYAIRLNQPLAVLPGSTAGYALNLLDSSTTCITHDEVITSVEMVRLDGF